MGSDRDVATQEDIERAWAGKGSWSTDWEIASLEELRRSEKEYLSGANAEAAKELLKRERNRRREELRPK